MERKEFLLSALTLAAMPTLSSLKKITDTFPNQSRLMPVLFTSHGNPMDIPLSRGERPFWQALYDLGQGLMKNHEIKAAVVVSAHWCTRGSFVNISESQNQIYDYYGFPEHYYDPKYHAKGAPEIAKEISQMVPSVSESTDWGLDHGAWPMLMHLFPGANVPVFQLSLDYYAKPEYHYNLGLQLKELRKKGVLIIGSGSLIHNLQLVMSKMRTGDMRPIGWESEYDAWLKTQLDQRNVQNLINYENSHALGKLAAPTPDHYVPVLYSLGLMDKEDELKYFYEGASQLPAFSERSFVLSREV